MGRQSDLYRAEAELLTIQGELVTEVVSHTQEQCDLLDRLEYVTSRADRFEGNFMDMEERALHAKI